MVSAVCLLGVCFVSLMSSSLGANENEGARVSARIAESFRKDTNGVKLGYFQRRLQQMESNYTSTEAEDNNNVFNICFDDCTKECDIGCNGGCDSQKCDSGCNSGCDRLCDDFCDGCDGCNSNSANDCNYSCDYSCDGGCDGCDDSCDESCKDTSCDEGCTGGCDTGCTAACEFVNISMITGEWITYYDEDLGKNVTDWDFTGRGDGAVNLSNNLFYVLLVSVAALGAVIVH